MAPLENRVLPPRSASGAFSRTMTDAPASRAAMAAHSPAMLAPTTSTSVCSTLTLSDAAVAEPVVMFSQTFRMTANVCEHEVVPRGGIAVALQHIGTIQVFQPAF